MGSLDLDSPDPGRRGVALLRRKAAAWRRLGLADRMLIVEAGVLLGAAGLALATLPFARYGWWLRLGDGGPSAETASADRIGMAVQTAARNVPWPAVCLPQAMAAKAMLARRGRSSVLCVGVIPSESGSLLLHAWLEVRGRLVTGGPRTSSIAVVKYGGPLEGHHEAERQSDAH